MSAASRQCRTRTTVTTSAVLMKGQMRLGRRKGACLLKNSSTRVLPVETAFGASTIEDCSVQTSDGADNGPAYSRTERRPW